MLAAYLEGLPDAAQMRAIDAWASGPGGVPAIELMERAGAGLAALAQELAPDGRIVVFAGKGNNGGDGLVAARLLRNRGRTVDVVCQADPQQLSALARTNLDRLPGPPPQPAPTGPAALLIDALLGTGSTGAPRAAVAAAIEAINASPARVLAADAPSGVDAATGEVPGVAVRAYATAAFHAAKPGLWIAPGKQHAGEVHVLDIGIPAGAPVELDIGLIRAAVLELIPRRGAASTKFESGHVLVAGGSAGLTGAPCLVAEAAMRAGAGYVTACVPASLALVFEIRLLEVMTHALPDEGGALLVDGVDAVLELAARAGALVLGPGLGAGGAAFARELTRRAELPVVLDADGLNAHGGRLRELAARKWPTVLTPHDSELARLLGVERGAVAGARLGHARRAAALARAIVVCKGDDTLVAAPDGLVAVSPGDSPALATAGTGDVLAGVLGALLAKRIDPFAASCAAVMLHARAGRLAAAAQGGAGGVIASDVIAALPRGPRTSPAGTRTSPAGTRTSPTGTHAPDEPRLMRAEAAVNLAAIERNCARLAAAGPRLLCAVVKADGYGHGAAQCARAALAGGASWLAVASAAEAAELRAAGIKDPPILVMGALTRDEAAVAQAARADLVAWTPDFVEWMAELGGGRIHVKLDTGMGRLGTREREAADRVAAAVTAAPGCELVGAMTHFATADELDGTFFEEQLEQFTEWVAGYGGLIVHAANSAALLRDARSHFDMVRCGVAVYGLDPFGVDPAAHGLEPALELRSWVAAVKPCAAGQSAGYGRRFVAAAATQLGVLPIGYGDGWRRGLGDLAEVVIDGRRHRMVGTISMDNLTVDLGPDTTVRVGMAATLIGDGITAEEVAAHLATINYEITCGLLPRVPRHYHRDGVPQAA